jgi:hypothetical protein
MSLFQVERESILMEVNQMQEEVVNARITAHLSLALSYARRFSIGRKYLWNELVSEALFILTDECIP